MKLLIATPCFGGQVCSDYVGALLGTLKWCASQHINAELYFLKNSSSIGYARNNCAAYAMRREVDKLLFIDADQVWTDDDTAAILESKRTLIGGTYPKKDFPMRLNFNPTEEHAAIMGGNNPRDPEHFADYAKFADSNGEIEVKHVPTGFLLIDRAVLEAVAKESPTYLSKENDSAEELRYWDMFPSGVLNGRYETEDFYFCSEARAYGHPPYLNVNVVIDHIGSLTYRMPKGLRAGAQR